MSDEEDAIHFKTFGRALLRNPDDVDMLVSQFAHLFNTVDRRKISTYLPLARRAYLLDPNKYTALFNYGTALNACGMWIDAIAIFKRCVKEAPSEKWLARSYHHLGISYRSNGNDREAIEWYNKAIALTNDPEQKKDRALALMASGELNEGLQAFECRRECSEAGMKKHGLKGHGLLPEAVRKRHWEGQDLTGKTIVVYHEEGIGDFFMISRFIPRLRAYNPAKILLTGVAPDVLDLVADNIDVNGTVPISDFDADYIVGSMTLPWRTGVEMAHVSGKPYFKAAPATFPRRGLLNVGLIWKGNPVYGRNSHRSMDFTNFCPLFDIPGVAFYSLQVGEGRQDIIEAGYEGFVADLATLMRSWRQSASAIARLDAVISVDTACAHLAGALGVPVFMLATKFCDWRWDRSSSKTRWYDSMRVFRQFTQDDWTPLIQTVKGDLEDMVDERRQAIRSDTEGKERSSEHRVGAAGG